MRWIYNLDPLRCDLKFDLLLNCNIQSVENMYPNLGQVNFKTPS